MKASRVLIFSMFLGLLTVSLASPAFSAPLKITGKDTSNFGGQITGGDQLSVKVNFTNTLEHNMTVAPVIRASSDVGVDGPEFQNFRGYLNGTFGCKGAGHGFGNISFESFRYFCGRNGSNNYGFPHVTVKPGGHRMNLTFDVNLAIAPAKYDLKLDLKSLPGNTQNVGSGSGTGNFSFSTPDSVVHVNVPSTSQNLSKILVYNFSNMVVSPPKSKSEFLNGLKVEVFGPSGEVAGTTGSVNFSYSEAFDQGDYRVGVYYFNDSRGSWVNVTDERNRDLNYVYADVDHFSTYAAFSRPKEEDTQNGNGRNGGNGSPPGFGGGGSVPPGLSDEGKNSSQGNQSVDEGNGNGGGPADNRSQGSGEGGGSGRNGTDTGQEGSEGPGKGGSGGSGFWFGDGGFFTGFASQSPTGGFIGFLLVVAALLIVLQYSGKVDVKDRTKDVLQRVRP